MLDSSPMRSAQACITLRRPGSTDSLSRKSLSTPTLDESIFGQGGPLSCRSRNNSNSSLSSLSNKLTGTPRYSTFNSDSQSSVVVHPVNPRHVRGGSIASELSSEHSSEDGTSMEQIIPLQSCSPEMLVPLLHRHLEMRQLIACNPSHFSRLKASLGTDKTERCLQLWTETTRAEMDDNEWLCQTRNLLKGRSSPDWSLWCEIVGWDPTTPLIGSSTPHTPQKETFGFSLGGPESCGTGPPAMQFLPPPPNGHERRRSTSSSLLEEKNTIVEEDESEST